MTPLITQTLLYLLYSFWHLYAARNREPRTIRLGTSPPAVLYRWYALSSFHYTVVGLTFYWFPLSSAYYHSFFPLFLCLQGGVSFLSDVVFLERTNHWSQYLDRTFASYNMLISLLVLRECFAHSQYELVIIVLGMGVKKVDDHCFTKQHIKSYMIFHILWHTILPAFGIYKAVRGT